MPVMTSPRRLRNKKAPELEVLVVAIEAALVSSRRRRNSSSGSLSRRSGRRRRRRSTFDIASLTLQPQAARVTFDLNSLFRCRHTLKLHVCVYIPIDISIYIYTQ